MAESEEVQVEQRGCVGLVTLNRPQALNALTHGMVKALRRHLDQWEQDPKIAHVVLRGAGDKAFCAGGDIRRIYELGREGNPLQRAFFADEYRLNTRIYRYKKPIVSLIDGIVMGGGVGLSVHGRYRVGSARTVFAMPEVAIGFFPDVGGSYFLPRLRSAGLGLYCALTAGRLKTDDAYWAGVLTHCVDGAVMGDLTDALSGSRDTETILAAFSSEPGVSPLADRHEMIEQAFGRPTVVEILDALQQIEGREAEWARGVATTIRSHSPTSLSIAIRQLNEGANATFEECMRMEYRILSRILQGHDFYEGVRSVIIDKDGRPHWNPARLEDVENGVIDAHFRAPNEGDLTIE